LEAPPLKKLTFLLAAIVLALSVYVLAAKESTKTIISYLPLFLALMLITSGITEFRQKNKVMRTMNFLVSGIVLYFLYSIHYS